MLAPGEDGDAPAAHPADEEVAAMPGDAAAGKPFQFRIGDGQRVLHQFADGGQARAEHESGGDRFGAGDLADGSGGLGHSSRYSGPKLCGKSWSSVCTSGVPSTPWEITSTSGSANSRMRWRQPPQGVTGMAPGPVT